MRTRIKSGLLGIAVLLAGLLPAFAGEVFGGTVTEVRSAEVIVVNYGRGQYVVRIVGIVEPEGPVATAAKEALTSMLLGKKVYARLQGRNRNGEMVSRLFLTEPWNDVGLELTRRGLVRRQQGADYQFEYKYGELTRAENEARQSRRGLWANQ